MKVLVRSGLSARGGGKRHGGGDRRSAGPQLVTTWWVAPLWLVLACGSPGADDIGEAAAALSIGRDDLLAELAELHRSSMEDEMDRMEPSRRSEVMARLEEIGEDPFQLGLSFTAAGTPRQIIAPGFSVSSEYLGLADGASPEEIGEAFALRFAGLWDVDPSVVTQAQRSVASTDHLVPRVSVSFQQMEQGRRVVPARLTVHVDPNASSVRAVTGSFLRVDEGRTAEPAFDAEQSRGFVPASASERVRGGELVYWSEYRTGTSAEATLAYSFRVEASDGAGLREVLVDGNSGDVLYERELGHKSLRRTLWDLRGDPAYSTDSCQRWQLTTTSWPAEVVGCPAACNDCLTDMQSCALCACGDASETGCENDIWQYDESTGCLADGSPFGEPNCDSPSQQLWDDAADAYAYWASAFGRDGWNDDSSYLRLKSNVNTSSFGGLAQPKYVDSDSTIEFVQVSIRQGSASAQLHGHELGHALQYGLAGVGSGSDFWSQGRDILEHNADVQGYRYRGATPPATSCGYLAPDHYTDFWTQSPGQINKAIGNCHYWLATQTTAPSYTHYGVSVQPTSLGAYDQTWYRALYAYHDWTDTYFDFFRQMSTAAWDLYGFGSEYYTMRAAGDAVGGRTAFEYVAPDIAREERPAAVGWNGAPRGPCVFWRRTAASTGIEWRCYQPSGWVGSGTLNDPSVDPAASEPAATFRYENGVTYVYVFWRGSDDRIHYRRLDVSTLTIGPPMDLGPSHLTSDSPAVAPIFETGSLDRLMVVYHPLPASQSTWFFATHVGSTAAPVDLGPAFDSDAPPSLVGYPYFDRVYFVRPDLGSAATPRHLRYASYTLAAGWSSPAANDLTAAFNANSEILHDAVRTNGGVALAPWRRSSGVPKLRMSFVTLTDELWYATLEESTAGTLIPAPDYNAIPLASVTASSSAAAGALAESTNGQTLWHLWGQAGGGIPDLHQWRTFSD